MTGQAGGASRRCSGRTPTSARPRRSHRPSRSTTTRGPERHLGRLRQRPRRRLRRHLLDRLPARPAASWTSTVPTATGHGADDARLGARDGRRRGLPVAPRHAPTRSGPRARTTPRCRTPTDPPAMFAIPGNHDWYDGLTAFLRVLLPGRLGRRLEDRAAAQLLRGQAAAAVVAAGDRHPVRHLHRQAADGLLPDASPPQVQDGRRHHPVQRQAELGRGRQAAVDGVRDPRLLHHQGAGQEPGPGAADAGRRQAPLRALLERLREQDKGATASGR